jgi:hypothetical protein
LPADLQDDYWKRQMELQPRHHTSAQTFLFSSLSQSEFYVGLVIVYGESCDSGGWGSPKATASTRKVVVRREPLSKECSAAET